MTTKCRRCKFYFTPHLVYYSWTWEYKSTSQSCYSNDILCINALLLCLISVLPSCNMNRGAVYPRCTRYNAHLGEDQPFLSAWRRFWWFAINRVFYDDTDLAARMRRLIRVLAEHTCSLVNAVHKLNYTNLKIPFAGNIRKYYDHITINPLHDTFGRHSTT